MKPIRSDAQIQQNIESALRQRATTEAHSIQIELSPGGKVTLTGRAASWRAINEAVNIAWDEPGVTAVIDRVVRPMSD